MKIKRSDNKKEGKKIYFLLLNFYFQNLKK